MMLFITAFRYLAFLQYGYKARAFANHSSFSNCLVKKTITQIYAGVIMLTRIDAVNKLLDVFGQSKSAT